MRDMVRIAPILLAILFLAPSVVSQSPVSATSTSADCWVGFFPAVRSPVDCAIRLDLTFTGHGCDGDRCSYTLGMTGTGTSALPAWLVVQMQIYTGAAFACVGSSPERDLTGDLFACKGVCDDGILRTEVACPASLEVVQEIPAGECHGIVVVASLFRRPAEDYAATGWIPGVCHRADGSLDFEP